MFDFLKKTESTDKDVKDTKDTSVLHSNAVVSGASARGGRRLEGVVVSDKMKKTVVIAIHRLKKHPKYLKYYKVTTRLKAHDENNEYHIGDKVVIEETRPLSKEKRWKVISKKS